MPRNPVPCPDCDRPTLPRYAAAAPPFAVVQLCSACGYHLARLDWPQWAALGWPLDFKDEFRLLDYQEGDDDAIAA